MESTTEQPMCLTCGHVIPHRKYQDVVTVRACSPTCASTLAKREHGRDFPNPEGDTP